MKRIILFLCWACHALTYAQVVSETTVDDGTPTVETIMENLDFTEVSTGLLIDAALQWRKAERYDGTTLTDANLMDVNDFGYLYATLNDAVIDQNSYLPLASATYMGAYNSWSEGNPIPIAILDYNYHRFDKKAIDNNLISESGGQLFDVPNRPNSPYEEQNLFAASPVINQVFATELQFVIPSNTYISNLATAGNTIAVDFGDGAGFVTLSFDTPVAVTYSESGTKEIIIKVTDANGVEKVSHAQFTAEVLAAEKYGDDPDFEPGLITATESFQGTFGSATVTGFTHCGDGIIRKPLIVVEGFNPSLFGERGFAEIKGRFGFESNGISIEDYLDQNEYDLIFVDFTNGADFIQRSAMVVKEVIRRVNAEKAAAGSTEENVILGYSMGGIVSKYALLDFESEGIAHETAKLITFDSPLQGVNAPLGAQHLLKHVIGIEVPTGIAGTFPFPTVVYTPLSFLVPEIIEARAVLLSPAARQMLYLHAYPEESLHDSFYAELAAKGTPEDFEMVGILNGAQTGTPQLFAPGDLLFELEGNLGDIISDEIGGWAIWGDIVDFWLTDLLGIDATVDFEIHALPDNPSSPEEIYEGKIHVKLFHLFGKKQHKKVKIKENVAWDSAPGGMFGGVIPDQAQGLIDAGFLTVNANSVCFVPSISAANIDPAISNNNPFFPLADVAANVTSGATDFRAYAGSTMNTTSFGINQINTPHVAFSAEIAAFFLSETTAAFNLNQSPLTKTYNYGESGVTPTIVNPFISTPDRISENLTIAANGKLWVNRIDRIGFTDEPNPQNTTDSEFDLRIVESCQGNTVVEIANGGEFTLGEWTNTIQNTADVYVTNNARIVIKNGGLLSVSNSSKLIIQSGAEVIIESGGLLDCSWNAQVIVEAGGILRVENNGQLRPGFNSQVWVQPGGQLILGDGAKVQLWNGTVPDADCNIKLGGPIIDPDNTPDVAELVIHGAIDFSGNGYFDIHPNSNVELVGDADFKIDGLGKGYRFLKLSNAADLVISKNKCQLSNGKVAYSQGSTISLSGTAVGHFTQMEFAGVSGTTGVTGDKCESIFVSTSDFTNFGRGIYATGITGSYLGKNVWVYGSEFMDCATAIDAEALDNILVWDTHIATNAPEYSGVGLQLTQVNNAYLTNADIENLDEGVLIWGATDFVMNGGNIHDCRLGINLYDAPSDFLTNSTIDLIGQATLQNNFTGIFGVQSGGLPDNTPFPMITLDCARLIENLVGIRGRDLLLNIDGGSETAPNVFIVKPNFPKSKILELCYYNLEMTSIAATNNYWGPNANIARAIFHSDNLFNFCGMYSSDGPNEIAAPNIGVGNIPLVFEPILAQEPTGCSEPGEPGGPIVIGGDDKIFTPLNPTNDYKNKVAECLDSQQRLIYENYWRAYGFYLAEAAEETGNHTNSRGAFGAIAQLANDDKGDYSEICRMLIEKARSRAGYIPSRNVVNGDIRKISTGCRDLAFEMNPDLQKLGFRQIQVWYSEVAFEEGIHPKDSQPEAKTLTVSITEKAIQDWSNANFQIVDLNPSTAYFLAYELVGASASSSDIRYFSNPLSTNECPRKFYDDSGVYFDEDCQINGIWWSFEYGKTNGYFKMNLIS